MCDQLESESEATKKDWLPSQKLSMDDYHSLKNGDWLTDNLINVAQTILKKSHPHVGGLQTTTKGEVLSFDIESGEFVQILNIARSHWITVSTIGCSPGVVNVFDSLYQTLIFQNEEKSKSLQLFALQRRNSYCIFKQCRHRLGAMTVGFFLLLLQCHCVLDWIPQRHSITSLY